MSLNTQIWAEQYYTSHDSDIIEKPSTEKVQTGWLYGEKPSHKDFNYLWNRYSQMLHLINTQGILPWDSETEYQKGSVAVYDGELYISLTTNMGTTPIEGGWSYYDKRLDFLDNVEAGGHDTNTLLDCTDSLDCTSSVECSNYILRYNATENKWISELSGSIELPGIGSISEIQATSDGYLRYSESSGFETSPFSVDNLKINDIIPELKETLKDYKINYSDINYKPQEVQSVSGVKVTKVENTLYLDNKIPQVSGLPFTKERNKISLNGNIAENIFYKGETIEFLYSDDEIVWCKNSNAPYDLVVEDDRISWKEPLDGWNNDYKIYNDTTLIGTTQDLEYIYDCSSIDKTKIYVSTDGNESNRVKG